MNDLFKTVVVLFLDVRSCTISFPNVISLHIHDPDGRLILAIDCQQEIKNTFFPGVVKPFFPLQGHFVNPGSHLNSPGYSQGKSDVQRESQTTALHV